MREIKFRGRRLDNGEWVYGSLISVDDTAFIIEKSDIDYNPDTNITAFWFDTTEAEVDLSTVGQYTGLHDKEGREIYEGDITLTQGQNCRFIQVVEFHNTRETCGRGWVGVNHKKVDNFGHDYPVQGGFSYFEMPCSCEIIGNIHDNPELLKTE